MKITKLIFSLFIYSIFLITSCTKENDLELDKQIRINGIGSPGIGSYYPNSDTSWKLLDGYRIINFNKNNYSDIKTIVFSALIFSTDTSNYCNVELYNLTDKVSIKNSQIKSNQLWGLYDANSMNYIESANIINSLPDKTINLAVRIKSSKWDTIPAFGNSGIMADIFLFLYR
jgi:hypothetical protein